MASGNSWADQWDTTNDEHNHNNLASSRRQKDAGKMAKFKGAALTGFEKAKEASMVGAQKMKSGTSASIKWVKNQYRKRMSK